MSAINLGDSDGGAPGRQAGGKGAHACWLFIPIPMLALGVWGLSLLPWVGPLFGGGLAFAWGAGLYVVVIIYWMSTNFARTVSASWTRVDIADAYAALTLVLLSAISAWLAARQENGYVSSASVTGLVSVVLILLLVRFLPRWTLLHDGWSADNLTDHRDGKLQEIGAVIYCIIFPVYTASVMLVIFSTYLGLQFAYPRLSANLFILTGVSLFAAPLLLAVLLKRLPPLGQWMAISNPGPRPSSATDQADESRENDRVEVEGEVEADPALEERSEQEPGGNLASATGAGVPPVPASTTLPVQGEGPSSTRHPCSRDCALALAAAVISGGVMGALLQRWFSRRRSSLQLQPESGPRLGAQVSKV